MSGVLVSYEGKKTTFWYACPDKKLAAAIIAHHQANHAREAELARAQWVEKWDGEKPVNPESLEIPKS